MRAVVFSVVLAALAFADPPDAKSKSYRELNGHFFIPSLTVADPFVPTVFGLVVGAGAAWVDGPGFDPRGNPVGSDSYVAAALSVTTSFQVKLLSWWAVRLAGVGGLVGGFDVKSALVLGATIPFDVIPGTTVSWRIGRFVQLGGSFDFDYQHSRTIEPLAAVQRSLVAQQVDASQVREKINSFGVLPGATVAIAPHPAVGLVATVQYLWLRRDDGTSTTDVNNLVFGVVAQLDLKPLVAKAPLGIVAAYRARVPLDSSQSVAHDVEGGIYYTGKDALVLGVVAQGRWFELRPGFEASALIANVVVRYFWN